MKDDLLEIQVIDRNDYAPRKRMKVDESADKSAKLFDKSISSIEKDQSFHFTDGTASFSLGRLNALSSYSENGTSIPATRKSYKCQHCGEIYYSKAGLNFHLARHRNPYECKYCGQQFVKKTQLVQHVRMCMAELDSSSEDSMPERITDSEECSQDER